MKNDVILSYEKITQQMRSCEPMLVQYLQIRHILLILFRNYGCHAKSRFDQRLHIDKSQGTVAEAYSLLLDKDRSHSSYTRSWDQILGKGGVYKRMKLELGEHPSTAMSFTLKENFSNSCFGELLCDEAWQVVSPPST